MMPGAQMGLEMGMAPGRRLATGGFNLYAMPGLQAVFDASNAGSFVYAGSGKVQNWNSSYGTYGVSQVTDVRQPTRESVGGYPAVNLNGSQCLGATGGLVKDYEGNVPYTWFVTKRPTSEGGTNRFAISAGFTGGSVLNAWWNGQEVMERNGNGAGPYVTFGSSPEPCVMVYRYDGSSGRLMKATATATTIGTASMSGDLSGPGEAIFLGAYLDGGSYGFLGGLHEIDLFRYAFTDGQIESALAYLKTKWGITGSTTADPGTLEPGGGVTPGGGVATGGGAESAGF